MKLPHDVNAENAVLGSIIMEPGVLPLVLDYIAAAEQFYIGKNQQVYAAMLELFASGKPIDLVEISAKTGDIKYLTELANATPTSANVEFYARIVKEKAIRRELYKACVKGAEVARCEASELDEAVTTIEAGIQNAGDQTFQGKIRHIKELAKSRWNDYYSEKDRSKNVGVKSGFKDLDDIITCFKNGEMTVIAGRTSMGKCLGKGTKVLMYDGQLKNVEDIRVGDLLMGDDSTPRTVLSLARGREMMYWIRQVSGIDYRVNESHILSLKKGCGRGSGKKGDVINLSVREFMEKPKMFQTRHYKGYKVPVDFPEKEIPVDPYFLGLWLGDGRSDSVKIYNTDQEIAEYLYFYAKELKLRVSAHQEIGRCPGYSIVGPRGSGNNLQGKLREIGVLNNKHIPCDYLINSRENRLKLLAGLIDSDGYYDHKQTGPYEITQKNEQFARQIKFLCDTLGFTTTFKSKKATIKETGFSCTVYRVRFNGNVDTIPVKVQRKKAKPWLANKNWSLSQIRVVPDRVDDYYGFEIDGNGLFLLEDMTVTHNTTFALDVVRNVAKQGIPALVFSLEMRAERVADRLICAEGMLPGQLFRKGEYVNRDSLSKSIAAVHDMPIFVYDQRATTAEIKSKSMRVKNLGLVVVDFLTLIKDKRGRNFSTADHVGEIAKKLQETAKELNVPFLVLSQMNREIERRESKKPNLSDLRDSGNIEEAADCILFLHRPSYYDDSQPKEIANVYVAKQRDGPTGMVQLRYFEVVPTFRNLGRDYHAMGRTSGRQEVLYGD